MGKSKEEKEDRAKEKFERYFVKMLNRMARKNPDIAILNVDLDVRYIPGYKNKTFKLEEDVTSHK